jgi:uncharacterized protein
MSGDGLGLGERLSRVAALRPAKRAVAVERTREDIAPSQDVGELVRLTGAVAETNDYGSHLVIRRWFPTPAPCFESADSANAKALRFLVHQDAGASATRAALDCSQWLFLDTETTGLTGGSGMYAFLVGLAWFESGGLQVEQLFMRDFADEHALLMTLNEHMAKRRVLVTFNGKSFDWPLLETRFRMTRVIEPRTPAVHLDFLHPARQIWRPRLMSVRLAELEREILRVSPGSQLDWSRDADVDGAAIPEIYFNFVRTGAAAPLIPVLNHNQMDLRGLAAIATRVLEMLALSAEQCDSCGDEPADLFGLARFLERRGEHASARAFYKSAIGRGMAADLERGARRQLARLSKRAGDHDDAIAHWESLLETQPRRAKAAKAMAAGAQSLTLERILMRGAMNLQVARKPRDLDGAESSAGNRLREMLEACEQLAIHFEHRTRDLNRAIQLTQHGLALVKRASAGVRNFADANPAYIAKFEVRFSRRLERLERKSSSAPKIW